MAQVRINKGDLVLVTFAPYDSGFSKNPYLFYSDGKVAKIPDLEIEKPVLEQLSGKYTKDQVKQLAAILIEQGILANYISVFGCEHAGQVDWRSILPHNPGTIFGYDPSTGFLELRGKDRKIISFGGKEHDFTRTGVENITWPNRNCIAIKEERIEKVVVGLRAIRQELQGICLEEFLDSEIIPRA